MLNQTHRIMRCVKYAAGGKPHYYTDTVSGWLSTSLLDMNGKEIFEGSVAEVAFDEEETTRGVVEFKDATLKVYDVPLQDICYLDIEVVGHVTEEAN